MDKNCKTGTYVHQGEMRLRRRAKCFESPVTAFDVSRRGRFLGVGSSDGAAPERS